MLNREHRSFTIVPFSYICPKNKGAIPESARCASCDIKQIIRYIYVWNLQNALFFQRYVFENLNRGLEENAVKLCDISKDDSVLEVGFGPGIGIQEAYMRIKGKLHSMSIRISAI